MEVDTESFFHQHHYFVNITTSSTSLHHQHLYIINITTSSTSLHHQHHYFINITTSSTSRHHQHLYFINITTSSTSLLLLHLLLFSPPFSSYLPSSSSLPSPPLLSCSLSFPLSCPLPPSYDVEESDQPILMESPLFIYSGACRKNIQ